MKKKVEKQEALLETNDANVMDKVNEVKRELETKNGELDELQAQLEQAEEEVRELKGVLRDRDNTIRESVEKMESFEHVENQLDE